MRLRTWLGRVGLVTKLILVSTLLTLVVVSASFLAINFEIRRQTCNLVTETLTGQQHTVRDSEQQRLDQLLRASAVLTESPTLRAALEVYRSEQDLDADSRAELLATIQVETGKISDALGRDLLVVTDLAGHVLALGGPVADVAIGDDLSERHVIRNALRQDGPVGDDNLGVLTFGGQHYRVGSIPVLLQGYIIGALALGDAMDAGFVAELGRRFGGDVALLVGDRVLATSLPIDGFESRLAAVAEKDELSIDGEDYVVASLPLGAMDDGSQARLVMLRSLTDTIEASNRRMVTGGILIGLAAVLLACVAALLVSRSVLSPLQRFVGFMRDVATTDDHSRRFDGADTAHEVQILAGACNGLFDSLQEHERRLLARAQEDLERLERMKESEKLAELGRMLSGAAHEINNPLTGVVGNIELLLQRNALDENVRQRLESVHDEGRRVVSLVKRLLHVAHRDSGEQGIVDVGQVLRQVFDLRKHDFNKAGMALDLDLSSEPLTIVGNELELQQVFINIVGNGFDALQGSGPSPALAARATRSAGRVVVELSDNGPGIEHPEKIFEFFYTTKPVGKGTGLGLGICHTIVQRLGGTIEADNGPHGGARFTLSLPFADPASCATTSARALPPDEIGSRASSHELPASVLVVEDEPAILELQLELLESVGARAEGVSSGEAAVERLSGHEFDLVVSDLCMPGQVSGKELFHWMQRHRPGAIDRFLFVTGDTRQESEFLEQCGVRYLAKPFTMDEYLDTLREAYRENS